MRDTIDMAREAEIEVTFEYKDGDLEWGCSTAQLKRFEAFVRADERKIVMNEPLTKEMWQRFEDEIRADEREAIMDEWWMCVQSDLENGVKSLNEQAATKWRKEYPEIAKFGAWLNERGETK